MELKEFIVKFSLVSGWAIECRKKARDAKNAEQFARGEVRVAFPQWHSVVANAYAEVSEVNA